jgi:glutathione peroxidase-family protein
MRKFFVEKYKVSFPMFKYVNVNGEGASDLWKTLTSFKKDRTGAPDEISGEWTKFLVDHNNRII